MARLMDKVIRATIFLLAAFLWVHALFFLSIQSPLIAESARVFRLATSEVVLVALLVLFTFLAASGFWKLLLSLLYIYFFPFVLIGYALYLCFLVLRAIGRWFSAQRPQQSTSPLVIDQRTTAGPALVPVKPSHHRTDTKPRTLNLPHLLMQPFSRFTLLWCVLLLVTTHRALLWVCLVVVLLHLSRKIFAILKFLFFSDALWDKVGTVLPAGIYKTLSALDGITRDAAPTPQLKQLWQQLNLYKKVLDFLSDKYLLSRWAWVVGSVVFGLIYLYIALLFSFAYYGISRVAGISYSWPESLVTSVFIPCFIADLPKVLWLRVFGGIHFFLVVAVGVGTTVNFLRRKLENIRKAASNLSTRFADESLQEKIRILKTDSLGPETPCSFDGISSGETAPFLGFCLDNLPHSFQ